MSSLAHRTLVVVILRQSRWNELALAQALAPLHQTCCLLFDNGGTETPPFLPPWRLLRDGRNPGVGPRYVQAAEVAKECGLPWLLLLDQDFAPPADWWPAYEDAVRLHPNAQAWAPRLECIGKVLSPFQVHRGLPNGPSPDGVLSAGPHIALNSGLLVRTEALLAARDALELCPLDFSDFALSASLARTHGQIAPVALNLSHASSTHENDANASRLARFAWFAHGARGWAKQCGYPIQIAIWVFGRAFKLGWQSRNPAFVRVAFTHFLGHAKP
ncbi:MAG: hypothetical protein RL318_1141 [Fibrobacterota bacterium]|jgi:hypothetical protein